MALSHESPGAGCAPGRSPQGAERTATAPTAAENRSPDAAPAGAGSVSGRSPQSAERTTAALSDPENRSAPEETPRRAPGPTEAPNPGAAPGTGSGPHPAKPAAGDRRGRRGRKALLLTLALVATLVLLALVSAGTGAYRIPTADVLASAQHRLGLGGAPLDRVGESVLWNVRLPRVVLALLVGASLGCAGALMQGVFGNPLAEPGVIGISAGAAVGAVAAIGLGLSFFGNWTITVCAFVAGLITVSSVYLLSRNGGKTEVVTLILTGIAVNAFAGALIGLFVFFADSGQVNQITFWQLGSLAQATWPKVLAVLPCAVAGLLVAPFYARRLDLLSLGERPARHLGIDVERLRLALILVVALLTAAAVAVAGVITFIGLLVPHLLRMANGPGHRFLVPGSALAGAVVLVAGDLAARTLAQPAELPLGVLTALIGSPFFFWLLRRTRRKQGGWA
ncbi:FecCD family ABC transporter permease [Streptomyces erythrochromogenes]|uniref:FecCD family ABC transporter permease n=1 Tax=Streptomyces erythrochromogenes TaxID=285574 RepID=UPI0033C9D0AE